MEGMISGVTGWTSKTVRICHTLEFSRGPLVCKKIDKPVTQLDIIFNIKISEKAYSKKI
jgi:hypothetical protein